MNLKGAVRRFIFPSRRCFLSSLILCLLVVTLFPLPGGRAEAEYSQIQIDTLTVSRTGRLLGSGIRPQYSPVRGDVAFYLNGTVAVSGNYTSEQIVIKSLPSILARNLTFTLWSNATTVKQQYLNVNFNVNFSVYWNFQYPNGQQGDRLNLAKVTMILKAPFVSPYNLTIPLSTVMGVAGFGVRSGMGRINYDFRDAFASGILAYFSSSNVKIKITSGQVVVDPVLWLEITGTSGSQELNQIYSRAGQRLDVGNFTNNTIEVVQVSFKMDKQGSPTGNAVVRIRKVSDDSIIANSTTTVDVSTLTSDGSYPWVAFTFTQVTVNVDARFMVEYTNGADPNYIRVVFTTAQDGKGIRTRYDTAYLDIQNDSNIRIYTPNTAPAAPGEFTASISWRPNAASNLVWRARDADGQGDLSTCRITGTVNSGGAFDFTYTFSTDGIAWTTQPTGLTAGTASKTSVNASSYAVTVPLTFSGAYAQIGTVTITTTNTRCTDADSATTALGSNTNVGTLYGRITWTINDDSGAALTPSGTVYLRWNNGTARQNSGNSVAVTGQTDTSVQYSVQWQNSTASNGYVFGEVTLTVNEAWENVTVTTLVYPSLTYAFRRADASTSITPTNIIITVPNNSTAKTLTSFSSLKLPNGTITVTSISYLGGNVRLNTTDSHSFTAASQTRTFNTRVYHGGSLVFRRNDNSTSITPTNMTVTAYNSTALTLTSFTSLIFGNGTNTAGNIYWGNANVRGNTSDTFSFTANSQSRTYNLRIYNILPGFNRNGGSALNTAVTSWRITSANGTQSGVLTGAALTTNGSATLGAVLWRTVDVTPASNSFTPSSTNPSFNVDVYADSGNTVQCGVDTGTIANAAFNNHQFSANLTADAGSKKTVCEVLKGDYRKQFTKVTFGGTDVTTSASWSDPTVTYTGTFSTQALTILWPDPTVGAPAGPPSPPPPSTPSGGGPTFIPADSGVIQTTTTTTTQATTTFKQPEDLKKQLQRSVAVETERRGVQIIIGGFIVVMVAGVGRWYYSSRKAKPVGLNRLKSKYDALKRNVKVKVPKGLKEKR